MFSRRISTFFLTDDMNPKTVNITDDTDEDLYNDYLRRSIENLKRWHINNVINVEYRGLKLKQRITNEKLYTEEYHKYLMTSRYHWISKLNIVTKQNSSTNEQKITNGMKIKFENGNVHSFRKPLNVSRSNSYINMDLVSPSSLSRDSERRLIGDILDENISNDPLYSGRKTPGSKPPSLTIDDYVQNTEYETSNSSTPDDRSTNCTPTEDIINKTFYIVKTSKGYTAIKKLSDGKLKIIKNFDTTVFERIDSHINGE